MAEPQGGPENDRPDPMRVTRKAARTSLPKRFYENAEIAEREGGFVLALDGRPARTPAKALVKVATRRLAEAIVEEWNNQRDTIDPATMPITRIVNSAIDGVSREASAVAADIVRYAGSDLLSYRAGEPEGLAQRQHEAWDPILAWAGTDLGAALAVGTGVIFVPQHAGALDAVARAVAPLDPVRLAALHVVTTLTGSAVLALAVARGRLEPEAAWAAAHIDEDYQAELWGADEEAQERRAARWREMEAASRILELAVA
jgi:chaperone required for assembly of F1-ATPase